MKNGLEILKNFNMVFESMSQYIKFVIIYFYIL